MQWQKEDFYFTGNLHDINLDCGHLIGWSGGGSRWEEGCSASAWILKTVDVKGEIRTIGAAVKYFNQPASSSIEAEAKPCVASGTTSTV